MFVENLNECSLLKGIIEGGVIKDSLFIIVENLIEGYHWNGCNWKGIIERVLML